MQLEISTGSVDVVVSRASQLKNDNDGRQKADQDTGVDRCREVGWSRWLTRAWRSKVSIAEQPGVTPRPVRHGLVTLGITAWSRNSPDEPPVCARHM